MNIVKKLILFSAMLVASTVAQSVQAQVRDAGAKVRGDYNFYANESARSFAAQPRVYRAPVASVAPQAIAPTQSSRSFSYNATKPEASCAATPAEMPDMPSMSNRAATENRSFSYQPAAPIRRQSAVGNAPAHTGADRNAAAKVLGQY
jgi:hypothetical protein